MPDSKSLAGGVYLDGSVWKSSARIVWLAGRFWLEMSGMEGSGLLFSPNEPDGWSLTRMCWLDESKLEGSDIWV